MSGIANAPVSRGGGLAGQTELSFDLVDFVVSADALQRGVGGTTPHPLFAIPGLC